MLGALSGEPLEGLKQEGKNDFRAGRSSSLEAGGEEPQTKASVGTG